ncbi:hypothetical protein L208DRAFT_1516788, partial [Tricholoma matsutake]
LPEKSNYDLELPEELHWRRVHNRFHVSLLRPYHASDDAVFPNRCGPDLYDFGAPDNAEWYVKDITSHRWKGCALEFLVKWSLGESTWEPLSICNELAALDGYLALVGAKDWMDLPKCTAERTRADR